MATDELSKEEIQKRAKAIEGIYQEYVAKLGDLKEKQNEIIDNFVSELEQRKIEEIKRTLE